LFLTLYLCGGVLFCGMCPIEWTLPNQLFFTAFPNWPVFIPLNYAPFLSPGTSLSLCWTRKEACWKWVARPSNRTSRWYTKSTEKVPHIFVWCVFSFFCVVNVGATVNSVSANSLCLFLFVFIFFIFSSHYLISFPAGISAPLSYAPLSEAWTDHMYYFSTVHFKRSGAFCASLYFICFVCRICCDGM